MSVKKDGFLFLRNVECTLKVEGKKGSTFLFHPCCPFFLQELSFSFFFLFVRFLAQCVIYPSSHPCSTCLQPCDICLILIPPPVSSLQCASFISGTQLGGRLRFSQFAGTILLFIISFLSSVIWDGSWSWGRGPTKPSLCQPAHTTLVYQCGSTGFLVLFGLA